MWHLIFLFVMFITGISLEVVDIDSSLIWVAMLLDVFLYTWNYEDDLKNDTFDNMQDK